MGAYVLIAEDDRVQAEVLRQYVRAAGFRVAVVHDGLDAVAEVRREEPDLLVLDVMLPGLDGLQVCRQLRRDYGLPVLMLTARAGEDDQLAGLEIGADDYLVKPSSPRLLMARIRGLLRRNTVPRGPFAMRRVGPLAVDPARHEVSVDDRRIECTRAEFAILATMSEQPERVFTRGQLLTVASSFDRNATDRAIDAHVVNLRRKIEENPRRPRFLVTVYGVGYKLTAGA
ncbi:response regulator [Catenuloplanes sp. NPDC051500]|uniref:response regulator n=1 Tax=Catenuloplanes sp. NPDC051500 TaxID=3363959 RepID=UPI003787FF6D